MKSVSWQCVRKAANEESIKTLISTIEYDSIRQLKPLRDEKTTVYLRGKNPVLKVVLHSFTGLYNIYEPR